VTAGRRVPDGRGVAPLAPPYVADEGLSAWKLTVASGRLASSLTLGPRARAACQGVVIGLWDGDEW
jgi:hypothetical protein